MGRNTDINGPGFHFQLCKWQRFSSKNELFEAALYLGDLMSRDKSWSVSFSGRVPEVRQLNENCYKRAELTASCI